jgi:hypothetical protein
VDWNAQSGEVLCPVSLQVSFCSHWFEALGRPPECWDAIVGIAASSIYTTMVQYTRRRGDCVFHL